MSDTNAQEPTMEEILASIRRIISEDDAPAAAAPSESHVPPLQAEPAPAPVHVPPPSILHDEDDVLELTEPLDPPTAYVAPEPIAQAPHFEETVGDLDVFSSKPAAVAATPAYSTSSPAHEEPLVGGSVADSSASHFSALARTVTMPKDGRNLEDVVRELLRPMLSDWLDRHLTSIVEARVQAEVERIARRHDY